MYKFFRVGLILIFTFVFQTVQAAEPKLLSASSFRVEPYDGRKHGRDYTGAWVTLYNVELDGEPFLRRSVAFEFSGNYPSKPVSSFL